MCNRYASLFLQLQLSALTTWVFPNYARVLVCDYGPNGIHTTVADLKYVPIKNFV